MNTATATALWVACPAEDGKHWLPWELYQITPPQDIKTAADATWWKREAHRWAREDRKSWPGHLIAVRTYQPGIGAGRPVSPPDMLDDYDLAPYADEPCT
jgi:hypothetical protein